MGTEAMWEVGSVPFASYRKCLLMLDDFSSEASCQPHFPPLEALEPSTLLPSHHTHPIVYISFYFNGINREECVAPIPGRPCLTGLLQMPSASYPSERKDTTRCEKTEDTH